MNNLFPQATIKSTEVAEMVEKQHAHLMRDIDTYIIYISTNPKLDALEFFIKSTYVDAKGETRRCYNITKKGCEFIAHKLTGQKGALFTATYINRFHELEKQSLIPNNLSPQLQLLINLELQQQEINQKLDQQTKQITEIKDTFVSEVKSWREELNEMFNRVQKATNINFADLRRETYHKLEQRGRCDLSQRKANLQERMKLQGATKTAINNVSKLDVIEADARLKEIYTQIIKGYVIKYVV